MIFPRAGSRELGGLIGGFCEDAEIRSARFD
jgi:hypothetical protein